MNIETLSLLIAAFVNGSLAIAALLRNFRSRLYVGFAIMAGAYFAHDGLSVLESFQTASGTSQLEGHIFSALISGPATVWFLMQLVPDHRGHLRKLLYFYIPVIGVFIIAALVPDFPRMAPLMLIIAHWMFVFPAGFGLYALRTAEQRSTLTRERMRLRFAFWGAVMSILLFVTDGLYLLGAPIPPLATFGRIIYLFFIFQTFIQRELMTAEEVIAKLALFGGIALMLAVIFSFLVSWVGNRGELFYFNTLMASMVIVVLFEPIRNFTLWATRRLFLKKNAIFEAELAALSLELRGLVEPTEIAERMKQTLSRCFELTDSSLFLLDKEGLGYVKVRFLNQTLLDSEIPASNPLVEYMNLRRGRPFVLETIESDRDSFHSAQPRNFCETCIEAMREFGADVVIPFLNDSTVVGFYTVTVGEKILLTNEQLRLFIPVSRQIAVQLKSSEALKVMRERDKLALVGEMAAGLAHEIKNPLGSIKGAAQLLDAGGDSSSSEFLRIIQDETNRLSEVLTDFLDYAKPRRNHGHTSCEPVKVVDHTAMLVLRDNDISFELKSDDRSCTIVGDPDVLKQVLLNLFLNAASAMEGVEDKQLVVSVTKITPRQGLPFTKSIPRYKIWEGWRSLPQTQRRTYVQIEVRDNGPGIPSDMMDKIFTPFYTTKPKGTGLGLSICQRLIESMGGTISVKPNQPTGAIFILHIPENLNESPVHIEGPSKSQKGILWQK